MNWFDDPTRATGHAAFAIAAVAAAVAARRRVRPDLRLWWTLAIVFALLWLEIALDWRFVPRTIAQAALDARGAYGGRGALQRALLVALGLATLLTVVAGVVVARRRQALGAGRPPFRRTTRIAFATTALLVAVFVVEAISLHAVDAVLYAAVGPLLAVGWMWVAASAVVVGMAAAHSRGR